MSILCRDETVTPAASARTTDANGRQSSQNENSMQNVGSWADRVKLLWWDGTGLCLLSKRLEDGQFRWPRIADGVMRLSAAQLSALVEGLDWARVAPREVERPRAAQ
jgi:IS66 Orf2 like protein